MKISFHKEIKVLKHKKNTIVRTSWKFSIESKSFSFLSKLLKQFLEE